jgi:uncharacterized pyridoxamine 5'-phosphate oxidase family protein
MKYVSKQIRDIEVIEGMLNESQSGILAYYDDKYKVNQLAMTFYYHDKNIYILFDNDNEYFSQLVFLNQVNFSVITVSPEEENKYSSYIQIRCNGIIKKVEDKKIIDDIMKGLNEKYCIPSETKRTRKNNKHCIIIDTDEIQAFEFSLEK